MIRRLTETSLATINRIKTKMPKMYPSQFLRSDFLRLLFGFWIVGRTKFEIFCNIKKSLWTLGNWNEESLSFVYYIGNQVCVTVSISKFLQRLSDVCEYNIYLIEK